MSQGKPFEAPKAFSDYIFQRFTVQSRSLRQETLWPWGKAIWLSGQIDDPGRVCRDRVQHGNFGYLCTDRPVLQGRWHVEGALRSFRVDRFLAFGMSQVEHASYAAMQIWGAEVDLVLNPDHLWRNATWTETDDHEHCVFCTDHICFDHNALYFETESGAVACPECHERYVLRRDISFVAI